jgi:transcriptional regulator with XRE-family HTH domain
MKINIDPLITARKKKSPPWSQAKLAAACGLSEMTIMRTENGQRESPETIGIMCRVLNVPKAKVFLEEKPKAHRNGKRR